jgi:cytochrome P450
MYPPIVPCGVSLPRMLRLARSPLRAFSQYNQEYGKNYYLYIGGTRKSLITTDPAVIQHVLQRNNRNYYKSEIQAEQMAHYLGKGLLTNDGPDWLRQRRLIQPGFHRDRIAALTGLMQTVVNEKLDKLSALAVPVSR